MSVRTYNCRNGRRDKQAAGLVSSAAFVGVVAPENRVELSEFGTDFVCERG